MSRSYHALLARTLVFVPPRHRADHDLLHFLRQAVEGRVRRIVGQTARTEQQDAAVYSGQAAPYRLAEQPRAAPTWQRRRRAIDENRHDWHSIKAARQHM